MTEGRSIRLFLVGGTPNDFLTVKTIDVIEYVQLLLVEA